jgi:hypothetical protein
LQALFRQLQLSLELPPFTQIMFVGIFKRVMPGAEPAPPNWGGQIEKKSFGGPKFEKIIKFGANF